MNVLDLFSGIGGFSLGLGRAGFTTSAFCEIDPFCRRVLARHWPAVPIHEDIRELDGEQYRGSVDLVCGGFPCQPFSVAGKRAGAADDRHLWPQMLRVIDEARPTWVIGENVAGITSMEFEQMFSRVDSKAIERDANYDYANFLVTRQATMVAHEICEDLESIGYEVVPFDIPACGVDAHHIRHRVWIVAYAGGERVRIESGRGSGAHGADSVRLEHTGEEHDVAHSPRIQSGREVERSERERTRAPSQSTDVADTGRTGLREQRWPESAREEQLAAERSGDVRNTGCGSSEGEGASLGGWPEPARWEPEPRVGRVATGIPNRVDRLRGLGNAVVPMIPEIIGRAILDHG